MHTYISVFIVVGDRYMYLRHPVHYIYLHARINNLSQYSNLRNVNATGCLSIRFTFCQFRGDFVVVGWSIERPVGDVNCQDTFGQTP